MLKKQFFRFKKPIPSLELYKLEFNDNEWTYVYCIETPKKITKKKMKEPYIFYGGLKSMTLKEKTEAYKNLINIEIYSIDDLYKLFNKQRKSDNLLRKEFKKEYKEDIKNKKFKENTFILKNKNQKVKGCMIVRAKKIKENETIFVGIKG